VLTMMTGVALFAAEACSGGHNRSQAGGGSATRDAPVIAPATPSVHAKRDREHDRDKVVGYAQYAEGTLQLRQQSAPVQYLPVP
jgi:hypothetical protein